MTPPRQPARPAQPARARRRPPWYALRVERLEDRLAPAAGLAPDLVVGRTLSTYSTTGVTNHTLRVTYTVYNEQADDLTGVLLTDTLQPGVGFQSASQLPDRSGPNLAWSLGTIHGYDRASVTLSVTVPDAVPLELDAGARAFATLDAGPVSADTPAAALVGRPLPAGALASTPDANTTDPFVQEQAAKLRYDPQAVFDYLNTGVGYESYTGSLRGARGTLWSAAGNSLDGASLGVALLRASGVPARYAHGTLPDPLAKQLILSMFPASYQTVGSVPAGATLADPANDPKLLAETRDHTWLQFDATGTGFVDADTSGLTGAAVGHAFTTATSTFAEVADALRHKVEVKLDAETYSQAAALFGLGGGLSTQTVLDQTFNSVDLVGRPLTVGQFVSQTGFGAPVFSSQTTTYSPYLAVGEVGLNLDESVFNRGADFQEVSTNFPLGTQVLTGLFLSVVTTVPGASAELSERSLYDRIGYPARQGTAGVTIQANPGGAPSLGPLDSTTIHVLSAAVPDAVAIRTAAVAARAADAARQLPPSPPASTADGAAAVDRAAAVVKTAMQATAASQADVFAVLSRQATASLARGTGVVAYEDRPRLILSSARLGRVPGSPDGALQLSIDLRRDGLRVVPEPGQTTTAPLSFRYARGVTESTLEGQVLTPGADVPPAGVLSAANTASVFAAAAQAGIGLVTIGGGNRSEIDRLDVSAEAKARVSSAVEAGKLVQVPRAAVTLGGTRMAGWYEIDPTTGGTVGVLEDGGHEGIIGFAFNAALGAVRTYLAVLNISGPASVVAFGFGVVVGVELGFVGFGRALGTAPQGTQQFQDAKRKISEALNTTCLGLGLASPAVVGVSPAIAAAFIGGCSLGIWLALRDPPVQPLLSEVGRGLLTPLTRPAVETISAANRPAGPVAGTLRGASVRAAGALAASWSGAGVTAFQTAALSAPVATVTDAAGHPVGSGAVSVGAALSAAVSGNASYAVTGTGSLAFYAPAADGLGVAGTWSNYSASVTGTVSITLTTDGLTLNGTRLPAGTYAITTNSATITGRGNTSSPDFAGSAAVTVTSGTVNLGPGSSGVTVGGSPLDVADGATLSGYSGTVTVAAGGNGLDAVTLNGTAANVLTVSATPGTLAADQNTPARFAVHVNTSVADTYALTAEAPAGWTVAIDAAGVVTATPAPGTQGGTYPVRVVAKSAVKGDLVAQSTVTIAVTPTAPGVHFTVPPDPLFTVPFNGAQIPSAFQATARNLGPVADTYTLTFAAVPAGFTLATIGTAVAVPAGQTGVLGLYLVPVPGPSLPAPGTVLTFAVTATSTADSALAKTVTVTLVVPEIHAVLLAPEPAALATTPGQSATGNVIVTNAGNVGETVVVSAAGPAGLTVSGLPQTVPLARGQSRTLTFTAAVASTVPLNSTLQSAVTATFGPAATPAPGDGHCPGDRAVGPGGRRRAGCGRRARHCRQPDWRHPRRAG